MMAKLRMTATCCFLLVATSLLTTPIHAQSGGLRSVEPPLLTAPSSVEAGRASSANAASAAQPAHPGGVLGRELLGIRNIGEVSTDITPEDVEGQRAVPNKAAGLLPKDGRLVHSVIYSQSHYQGFLAPAGFCHRPTYFEENRLERYGQSRSRLLQPWVSGAKFGANVVALPYKMAVEPPRQCRYYTHPYEAGRVAPHYFELYPADRRGALVEAATIAGLILIIP